jgi:ABC-type transport system involved in multi-copper enzyme maturation permease subunit
MNALVRKEIRLLLPAWIAAMALVILPGGLIWITNDGKSNPVADPTLFYPFGLAALLLGLSSFGLEFSSGNFSILLVQPISRTRIWRVKGTLLAIALLLLCAVFLFLFLNQPMGNLGPNGKEMVRYSGLICALIAACAVSGALWTTLLLRQFAAAFWLTILIPSFVAIFSALPFPEEKQVRWMVTGLVVYSVLGFIAAHRLFFRAQDVQWTGGNVPIPTWLRRKSSVAIATAVHQQRPLRALLRKELQSHHVSLFVGITVFVLHSILVVVRLVNPDTSTNKPDHVTAVFFALWFILWMALPFLISSVAVAEERKLGTLESQLCLPMARRTQFWIKLGVCLLLTVFFCGVIPWFVETVGILAGVRKSPLAEFTWEINAIGGFFLGASFLSFHASTLTRNTLQAMGAAVVFGMFAAWIGMAGWMIRTDFVGTRFEGGPLFTVIAVSIMLLTVLRLAYGNFKRVSVDAKVWRHNLLVVAVSLVFVFIATALVYNRTWELMMNLEPRHEQARLKGPVRSAICILDDKFLVLLPDGRLWMTKNSEPHFLYKYVDRGELRSAYTQIPLDGEFIGGSNWVAVAGQFRPIIALQSDGSLWQFTWTNRTREFLSTPQRVGDDSDWKAIAAGNSFFLAVKTNGTVWGWGNNFDNQLGPGPEEFTNGPVQIGIDSDWDSVFAAHGTSIGIKRDGSVWKWGSLNRSPSGSWYQNRERKHPLPVRWNMEASDWVAYDGNSMMDVVLRRDGTLWTSWLPSVMADPMRDVERWTGLMRFGKETDWADVSIFGGHVVGIKNDGTIAENNLYATAFLNAVFSRKPSRYSDWIAARPLWENGVLALAADGTLCCWYRIPNETAEGRKLLGPTRKPLWSLNIFTATKNDIR